MWGSAEAFGLDIKMGEIHPAEVGHFVLLYHSTHWQIFKNDRRAIGDS